MITMKIAYSKQAVRVLRRMPTNQAMLIRGKIISYAEDPKSLAGQVKKLQDREGYRMRVGKWRVIFDCDGNILNIFEIGPRGGIYR